MADAVILGAGLAGLCCARRLHQCGIGFRILEASDGVGGRVRTDVVDGFRLDRGFQIYLAAYPEGRRVLDLAALDLRPFVRGALVRFGGKFHRVVDPRAEFLGGLKSLFNPVGSAADKLRLAKLKLAVDRGTLEDQVAKDERLTLDLLRWDGGFTDAMIDRFVRPFLGGVFLERELATSSRFFRFVFRTFGEGPGAIPAKGMQAIPDQIAAGLPDESVRFHAPVAHVGEREVTLVSGETIRGRAVIVATDGPAASRLLGQEVPAPPCNGTVTLYYAANVPPLGEPILALDGDGTGPVNTLVELSAASPEYAPPGQSLLAASVVGVPDCDDAELDRQARVQMRAWFGSQVDAWRLVRAYRIPEALPRQSAGTLEPWQRPVRLRPGLYVCGDHRDNASIDGAMTSGFRAAQAVAEDLDAKRT